MYAHGFAWHCSVMLLSLAVWDSWGHSLEYLTLWGRVTHICISKLNITDSDNGLSPGRCQAIIWTNAGMMSIGPLGTNLSEILLEIYTFSFKKMHLKTSSGKWRTSCLGLNVLRVVSLPLDDCSSANEESSKYMITLDFAQIATMRK